MDKRDIALVTAIALVNRHPDPAGFLAAVEVALTTGDPYPEETMEHEAAKAAEELNVTNQSEFVYEEAAGTPVILTPNEALLPLEEQISN